jgi:DNA polymerase-3 subunit gamma/tau
VLKAESLGLSWSNLRHQNKKMNVLPGTLGSDDKKGGHQEIFTQDMLELQWLSMCNRMPQKYSGIATRMKNMTPVIVDMPNLEVVVPNEIAKDEMEAIKGSIISTLKLYLLNDNITLSMRVAENKEQFRVLTRKEQFEQMSEKNPAINRLRKLFDLELA